MILPNSNMFEYLCQLSNFALRLNNLLLNVHKTRWLWVEMLKATLQYCCILAEVELKENHTQSYLQPLSSQLEQASVYLLYREKTEWD